MFKMVIFVLLLCVAAICHAQQKVPIQEGTEVTVTVSANVLNRIAVENDRIVTVKGISGQFELDKDTELGQVFLKPLSTDSQELIHLFLTTENGHTYPLSLVMKEGPAQSILLMPLGEGAASEWQSSHYETVLKTIVQAMVNQTNLEGFVNENLKFPVPKIEHVKIASLQTTRGHQLQGQILEVSNTSKNELTLTEQQFYQKGVRAVAIANPTLPINHKTRVYVVR